MHQAKRHRFDPASPPLARCLSRLRVTATLDELFSLGCPNLNSIGRAVDFDEPPFVDGIAVLDFTTPLCLRAGMLIEVAGCAFRLTDSHLARLMLAKLSGE
jgi:hypothetical protein